MISSYEFERLVTHSQIRMQQQEIGNIRALDVARRAASPISAELQREFSGIEEQKEFFRRLGVDTRTLEDMRQDYLRTCGVDIRAIEEERRRLLPFLEAQQRQIDFLRSTGMDSRSLEKARRAFDLWKMQFVSNVFGERGWLVLDRNLSIEHFDKLFWLVWKEGKAAVDSFICKEFRKRRFERLKCMVKKWWKVPYLKKRKAIVIAAIRAHREGECALSIPALFPLIDGLTREIAATFPGKYADATTIKKLATTYMKRGAAIGCLHFEDAIHFSLYKNFNFVGARKPPRASNRHAVMHGRAINYASEANSLRVILLINLLVTIFHVESKSTQ